MKRVAKSPGAATVVPSTNFAALRRAGGSWAALLAGAVLAGCVSTSPPARFYLLEPRVEPGPKAEAGDPGVFLLVGPVDVASYLDRPQIVTRSGANEVKLAEFDRWAQPLKESLPKACAASLSVMLGQERVFTSEEPAVGEAKHRVTVEVLRFDGEVGGEVVLDARWTLFRGTPASIVSSRRTHVVKSAGSDGYRSLVAAMNEAVGVLCSEIAEAVKGDRLKSPTATS